MIKIMKIVTFAIPCNCGKSITVKKIKDAEENGWRIDSYATPANEDSVLKTFCPDCLKKENERLFNSEAIREKIMGKYYDKFPEKFKADALDYVGLSNQPKADKIYSQAWDRGHSSGYGEVLNELCVISEIFN